MATTHCKPDDETRFWRLVDKSSECWIWTGTRKPFGYGRFMLTGHEEISTHRFSYVLAHGAIPNDLWVLHHCDNPPCVNPSHLFLGTRSDNAKDRHAKGRTKKGHHLDPATCPRGERIGVSELTEEIVRAIRSEFVPRVVTDKLLSAKYGICAQQVWKIRTGKCWAHVK